MIAILICKLTTFGSAGFVLASSSDSDEELSDEDDEEEEEEDATFFVAYIARRPTRKIKQTRKNEIIQTTYSEINNNNKRTENATARFSATTCTLGY